MLITVPITCHAEARAVLADNRYVPPPVPQDGVPGTLAWLRAQVSRFSSGPVHAERRAQLEERLSALDPDDLRAAARAKTAARDGVWQGVPAEVLGEALGVYGLAPLIEIAARGYLSGEATPEIDAAVAELVKLVGSITDLTLLLQAHGATEGLIANALRHEGDSVENLLQETLRDDPPLLVTKRVGPEGPVEIDLVAANRDGTPHLSFGYGLRPCPASAHALAIAAGVLDELR